MLTPIYIHCTLFITEQLTRVKHSSTSDINPLSLHDALPILGDLLARLERERDDVDRVVVQVELEPALGRAVGGVEDLDRKSTRLNSSHANISYAVFCLKKKNVDQNLEHISRNGRSVSIYDLQ